MNKNEQAVKKASVKNRVHFMCNRLWSHIRPHLLVYHTGWWGSQYISVPYRLMLTDMAYVQT